MTLPSTQRSPNVILTKLPECRDTADQIVRDVIEGQPDATRRVTERAAA